VIVADVNLLAYLLLGGAETALAQQVLERDPTWAAPVLWRSEFRSILAAHMRQRGLEINDAWQAHELAEGLLGAMSTRSRESAFFSSRQLPLVPRTTLV
jgi:predicted nucleic acid-binding protein